jgi:hypothetical protein
MELILEIALLFLFVIQGIKIDRLEARVTQLEEPTHD